jgi:outer membrane protein OmpA-like peptidoglycan-associated protein
MAGTALPPNYFEEAKLRARENGADLLLLRRIAALQSEMEARGVSPDDRRIAAYMAALVPPESKRQLGISGGRLGKFYADEHFTPTTPIASRAELLLHTFRRWRANLRRSTRLLARDWKRLLRLALPYIALFSLIVVLIWKFWPQSEQAKFPQAAPTTQVGGNFSTPQTQTEANLEFYLWLAAIWFLALGSWLLYRMWRRQVLERDSNPDLGPVINLSLQLGRANLFAGPRIEQAWRQLRLRREAHSNRVDVSASIKATLAQAGYPSLFLNTRRVRPEYLIFSEREMPNDHLPEVGRALHGQMVLRQVDAMHFEFQGAPYNLRFDQSVGKLATARGFESLASVIARHEGARVLVSMESYEAVTSGNAAPSWLRGLTEQQRPFLLNPREEQYWDVSEELLSDHMLPSVPATSDGLLKYSRQVMTDWMASPMPSNLTHAADLPAFFSEERQWLIATNALDPRQHEAVIDNLLIWLTPQEMVWLRALALFPAIHRAYTHFSAMALFKEHDYQNLSFVKIARLPWFRVGYMPDWLREPLAKGMTIKQLEDAKASVQAFFDKNLGSQPNGDGIFQLRLTHRNLRKQKQFRARMQHSRIPALADDLLRSAFEQRDPLELTLSPISKARQQWYRRPETAAIASALLATVSLTSIQDTTQTVPVDSTSPTAPIQETAEPDQNQQRRNANSPTPPNAKTESGQSNSADSSAPKTSAPVPGSTATNISDFCVNSVEGAEVRSAPGGQLLGLLSQRTRLQYIDKRKARNGGYWIKVDPDGSIPAGWMVGAGTNCLKGVDALLDPASDESTATSPPIGGTRSESEIQAGDPKDCNSGPYIIYFEWDKSDLTFEAQQVLDNAVSQYLSSCQGAMVMLAGHTDRTKSASYNTGLSSRQNASVQRYLEAKGIAAGKISAQAFGESQNLVPTADGVREPQNRRVEITFGPGSGI